MSPKDQQAVLLVMEQDDPTADGDGAPDETAENAPEDAPGATEDDRGDVDRSRSTDAANTSSAPGAAASADVRKPRTKWVRSAFTWSISQVRFSDSGSCRGDIHLQLSQPLCVPIL